MAQNFKETAHLKTNMKKFHEGMDRIRIFEKYKKEIQSINKGPYWHNLVSMNLKNLEDELDTDAANEMIKVLNLPFSKKE